MKLSKKKSTRDAKKKASKKVKPEAKKKPKSKDKKSSDKKGDKKKSKKAEKLKPAKQKEKKKESAPKPGKKTVPTVKATPKKSKSTAATKKATKKKISTKVSKPAAKPKAKTTTKKAVSVAVPKKKSVTKSSPTTTSIKKAAAKKKTAKAPASKTKATTKRVVTRPAVKKVAEKTEKKSTPVAVPKKKTVTKKASSVASKKKAVTKKKAATKPVSKPKAPARKASAKKAKKPLPDIPAILLEGDEPRYFERRGPGARYDTGSAAPAITEADQHLVLPEAYGTKRIHLVARDPQWLYAHWDLTNEQLQTYNQLSRKGHLTLQVFESEVSNKPKVQIDVHPESRSWFAHVGKGGGEYYAVLGFHDKLGDWQEIAVSKKATTPPDSLSNELEATFTSIPVSIPFSELIKVVREYAVSEPKLAKALSLLQQANIPESAGFSVAARPSTGAPRWTEAQQQALADAVSMDEVRRVWIGSEEVLELIKGREGLSSEAAIPTSGISSITSLSSPFGGEKPAGERGFWFNVNAELIIYGATEPDASVAIGDREIKLREDGSFSYRFALPDGKYQLPIAATSADKVETRHADMEFARGTEYRGDVGKHRQDPALKKPSSENVS